MVYSPDESKKHTRIGLKLLADSVTATMGPKGRTIIIPRKWDSEETPQNVAVRTLNANKDPRITKDGVSVAEMVNSSNVIEQIVIDLVKQAARNTADEAGDGTTTSTLLAYHIYEEGMKVLEKDTNINPYTLIKGMQAAIDVVLQYIKDNSLKGSKYLREVAHVSSNGDSEIVDMVVEAMKCLGENGELQLADSPTKESYVEHLQGSLYESFPSEKFNNGVATKLWSSKNADILIYDGVISKDDPLLNILPEYVNEDGKRFGKNLVIICESVKGNALETLEANVDKNGKTVCCAFSLPAFAGNRHILLEDLATYTGAKILGDRYNGPLKDVKLSHLGIADVKAEYGKCLVASKNGDKWELSELIEKLKVLLKDEDNEAQKAYIKYRLANLSNGRTILFSGGRTKVEQKEKKDRVEDAILAAQSALEEGVVPGGGSTYLKVIPKLSKLYKSNLGWFNKDDDFTKGIKVIEYILKQPFIKILQNGGENKTTIDKLIKESMKLDFENGYSLLDGEFTNMVDKFILDPSKVSRVALENAFSVSKTLLTNQQVITTG